MQISVGCNCACAYCIVPSTRGREVSRPASELVEEVRATGRRRRARGDAARPERQLLRSRPARAAGRSPARSRELLAAHRRDRGIDRVRYTSPHPKDMREDVVRAHAELPSLCEHVHLPLQSGSSRILKAMRRTYSRERYLDRVRLIREHVPDCRADHRHHRRLPRARPTPTSTRRSRSSRRSDTTAPSPSSTHRAAGPRRRRCRAAWRTSSRWRAWSAWSRRSSAGPHERAQRFVGRTLEVLVEGPSRTDPSRLRGRSRHNKVVNFEGVAQPGELVPVHDHRRDEPDAGGRGVAARRRHRGLSRPPSRNSGTGPVLARATGG